MGETLNEFVKADAGDGTAFEFVLTPGGFGGDVGFIHGGGGRAIEDGHGDFEAIRIGKLHDGGEEAGWGVHAGRVKATQRFGNADVEAPVTVRRITH